MSGLTLRYRFNLYGRFGSCRSVELGFKLFIRENCLRFRLHLMAQICHLDAAVKRILVHKELCYPLVVFGAMTIWRIFEYGLAVTRRLRQFDIPADGHRQYASVCPCTVSTAGLVQKALYISLDFFRQRRPAVKHAKEDSFYPQPGINSLVDKVNRLEQLAKTLQRQEMRLQRNQYFFSRCKCV